MFLRFALAAAVCLAPTATPFAAPLLNVEFVFDGCDPFACDPDTRRRVVRAEGAEAFTGVADRVEFSFEARPFPIVREIFGGGAAIATAAGSARPGELRLGATSEMRTFGQGEAAADLRLQARASFEVNDVVFTGPGTSVSGVLPIHFSGLLANDAAYLTTFPGGSGQFNVAYSALRIDIGFVGPHSTGDLALRKFVTGDGTLVDQVLEDRGLLQGYRGGDAILEIPFLAPVGVPLRLEMTLRLEAFTQLRHVAFFQGFAAAAGLFGDTMGFVADGPTFPLPDGFTAHSVDAGIVNNRWIGASDAVEAPEPAPAGILALACLAFLARRTILRRDPERQEAVRCAARCRPWRSRSRRSSPS